MNPSHYSFMRFCGPTLLSFLQMQSAASTYCHPPVRLASGHLIQYETVSQGDFCYELDHWSDLHLPGYLHKPVETIVPANSQTIAASIENNLHSVIRAALLMLPEEFSCLDFFIEIARTAYDGKYIRKLQKAESYATVRKMVEPKLRDYLQLYLPHLKQHFSFCVQLPDSFQDGDAKIKQDKTAEVTKMIFLGLPSSTKTEMGEILGEKELSNDAINMYIQNHDELENNLKSTLVRSVERTQRGKELNNLLTAKLPNAISNVFASRAKRA